MNYKLKVRILLPYMNLFDYIAQLSLWEAEPHNVLQAIYYGGLITFYISRNFNYSEFKFLMGAFLVGFFIVQVKIVCGYIFLHYFYVPSPEVMQETTEAVKDFYKSIAEAEQQKAEAELQKAEEYNNLSVAERDKVDRRQFLKKCLFWFLFFYGWAQI